MVRALCGEGSAALGASSVSVVQRVRRNVVVDGRSCEIVSDRASELSNKGSCYMPSATRSSVIERIPETRLEARGPRDHGAVIPAPYPPTPLQCAVPRRQAGPKGIMR
jgi:hypothetical protein